MLITLVSVVKLRFYFWKIKLVVLIKTGPKPALFFGIIGKGNTLIKEGLQRNVRKLGFLTKTRLVNGLVKFLKSYFKLI